MGNLVKTPEILEALDIETKPITADTLVELEQSIQDSWSQRFIEYKEQLERQHEFLHAEAKICRSVQSALHTKNVPIPSLYLNQGAGVANMSLDENAVTEITEAAITYIFMGKDFETILEAVNTNPTIKSAWDKFLVILRMAGPSA